MSFTKHSDQFDVLDNEQKTSSRVFLIFLRTSKEQFGNTRKSLKYHCPAYEPPLEKMQLSVYRPYQYLATVYRYLTSGLNRLVNRIVRRSDQSEQVVQAFAEV